MVYSLIWVWLKNMIGLYLCGRYHGIDYKRNLNIKGCDLNSGERIMANVDLITAMT